MQVVFWYWWVAAALFLAIEVFAPGVVFLWLSVAAAAVGVALIFVPGVALEFQLLAFAALSLVAVIVGRAYVKRHPIATADPGLNRRGQAMVGRVFTLIEPIRDGRGAVRVGDSRWAVEGPELREGTRVKVLDVRGTHLIVEPEDGED